MPSNRRISQSMSLLTSSKSNEWGTPSYLLEAARLVLNGIVLDPASDGFHNQRVKAARYFTKEDNALSLPWHARSVWLNPPYGKANNQSLQGLFSHKLVKEYEAGHVQEAILLVNLYWSYQWFEPLRCRPLCFLDERVSFIDPATGASGSPAKASSALFYFGPDPEKFYRVFSQFGHCGQQFKKEASNAA